MRLKLAFSLKAVQAVVRAEAAQVPGKTPEASHLCPSGWDTVSQGRVSEVGPRPRTGRP